MSNLAARIKAETPEAKLSLRGWLNTLDKADREAVEDMALNPAWTNRAIVDLLHSEGVAVGKDAIAAWRVSLGFRR